MTYIPLVSEYQDYYSEANYWAKEVYNIQSNQTDGNLVGHGDEIDAFRHAYVTLEIKRALVEMGSSEPFASAEAFHLAVLFEELSPHNYLPDEFHKNDLNMDLWNDAMGSKQTSRSKEESAAIIKQLLDRGDLINTNKQADSLGRSIDQLDIPGTNRSYSEDPGVAYLDASRWLIDLVYPNEETRRAIGEVVGKALQGLQNFWQNIAGAVNSLIDDANAAFNDAMATGTSSHYRCPVVVDVDGDGMELVPLSKGVHFDLDNNGVAEKTGWVAPDDGFLVRDLNGNGVIDNQGEMFGQDANQTTLQKMATLDTNGNGKIDAGDSAFSQLRIWRDLNQDGKTQSSELSTLSNLGITSLPLTVNDVDSYAEGHRIDWTATWQKTGANGQLTSGGTFGDVFFATDQLNGWYVGQDTTQAPVVSKEAILLPLSRGYGMLQPLYLAATNNTDVFNKLNAIDKLSLNGLVDVNTKIAELLYAWAGVSGVAPESGTGNYNAKDIAFLEKFLNADYKVLNGYGAGGEYPVIPDYTDGLALSWGYIWETIKSRIMVQGPLEQVFPNAYYDFQSDALVFHDTLTDVLNRAKTLQPATATEKAAFWQEVGQIVMINAKSFNSTTSAVQTALDAAAGMKVDVLVNWLKGQTGNDNFRGSFLADAIDTGTGNDTVSGEGGNDSIRGVDGNDSLLGGLGDDTLVGGQGNDTMRGGTGADTYVYNISAGADSITDDGALNENDTILVKGYTSSQAVLKRGAESTDFVITFTGSATDNITVRKGLEEGANRIENITFADGVTKTISQMRQEVLASQMTTGNDTVLGFEFAPNTINALAGNDSIRGGLYADTIDGGAGNDSMHGDGGDDRITGGLGNDTMMGGVGADTYLYAKGDGADTVFESSTQADNDTLIVSGYTLSQATFSRVGNSLDLQINFTGSATDSIILQYALEGGLSYNTIETIQFADGTKTINQIRQEVLSKQATTGNDTIIGWDFMATTISGNTGNDSITAGSYADSVLGDAGNDTILAGAGNDTIAGGLGSDSLTGGAGLDIYNYAKGDGIDTILDLGSAGQADTLNVSGYTLGAAVFTRVNNGDDLQLTFTGTSTDSILLKGALGNNNNTIETINFIGSGTKTIDQIRTDVLAKQSTAANDIITGWSWIANAISGNNGDDSIRGGAVNDILNGDAGNDTLIGDAGDDVIKGGLGSDSLMGSDGSDTYQYTKGDGADTIFESSFYKANDTLQITGYALSDATFSRVGASADLKITFVGNTTDSITIQYEIDGGTNGVETINFSGGGSKTQAEIWSEILAKMCTTGNDTVAGWDWTPNTISGNTGNDSITGGSQNDVLAGDDGNDTLKGGLGNDSIMGRVGNDVVMGDAGNDTLNGGAGIDTLTGGAGNDVFLFTALNNSVHAGNAYDQIADFTDGVDLINVAGLGFNHITTNATTALGELKVLYDSVAAKTFIHSDQNDFDIALNGDFRGKITDADFIFA